ncbi:hypothetical protein CFter6_3739 [Collimonas fungivorans]|uniref:Uncharacterized protein n=1 Tax=Collimonas fungivorans TaxID=158899 RepID=A0A127PF70_9BURK|nr:hypothetical protein [Collimonas fungivorans]AMO96363.1 hypothetical protein CFter6_3739 [Collimonas fungivorans]
MAGQILFPPLRRKETVLAQKASGATRLGFVLFSQFVRTCTGWLRSRSTEPGSNALFRDAPISPPVYYRFYPPGAFSIAFKSTVLPIAGPVFCLL